MILTPVTAASPVIQLHLLVALIALGLGAGQLALAKGTAPHRLLGYIWVGMMTVVALSSFLFLKFGYGARSALSICSARLRWPACIWLCAPPATVR